MSIKVDLFLILKEQISKNDFINDSLYKHILFYFDLPSSVATFRHILTKETFILVNNFFEY